MAWRLDEPVPQLKKSWPALPILVIAVIVLAIGAVVIDLALR